MKIIKLLVMTVAMVGLSGGSNLLASAKGGAQGLLFPSQQDSKHVSAPAVNAPMWCSKCKMQRLSIVDRSPKGAVKESKVVYNDSCPGCESKRVIIGTGKLAKEIIQHSCHSGCGDHSGNCCELKKS